MTIHSFFIMNKNAGMVYSKDFATMRIESEMSFDYPLDIIIDRLGNVKFGARDSIKIGHSLISVNGNSVYSDKLDKNKLKMENQGNVDDVIEYLQIKENFPVKLKFGKKALTTNDKLVLTGRFFGLYSLAWQLAPIQSSGIELIETDMFRLYCFHTMTGIKFIAIADTRQQNVEQFLRKTYEIYSDYALKNPFYLMDQPIRSDLFDSNLQATVDTF